MKKRLNQLTYKKKQQQSKYSNRNRKYIFESYQNIFKEYIFNSLGKIFRQILEYETLRID